MTEPSGFREIEHTADWTLEVWAPTFGGLCEQAIAGMAEMSGLTVEPTDQVREIRVEAIDREQTLVSLLSEVLYLQQADRFGVADVEVSDQQDSVTARISGGPVTNLEKEIKAVTWYDLDVVATDDGVRARVTFDV